MEIVTAHSTAYRPEIDGLRAIAVSLVVLSHMSLGFPGGYIGVDVFFVISGYLITKILISEIDAGNFSIARFYQRRIRRIVPAYVFMLLLTTAAASFILLPEDFKRFGEAAIATNLFVSNFYHWRTVNYFDGGAIYHPLLHTWSLSVEEQFYLLFPCVVLVLSRLGKSWLAALFLAATVVSFVLSEYLVRNYGNISYYFPGSRAGELLLGSLVVLGERRLGAHARRLKLDLLGIGLIFGSAMILDETSKFPGIASIAPCVGTALAIIASRDCATSSVAKFLSARPMIEIGLLSYSIYLFHWPVLSLFANWKAARPEGVEVPLLLATILAISFLSRKYVERPALGHV